MAEERLNVLKQYHFEVIVSYIYTLSSQVMKLKKSALRRALKVLILEVTQISNLHHVRRKYNAAGVFRHLVSTR